MSSILCIEDEKDLREDIVDLLRESGYETYEASNGLEGMDVIRRTCPDLVLCDITMPKMNGRSYVTFCRRRAARRPSN